MARRYRLVFIVAVVTLISIAADAALPVVRLYPGVARITGNNQTAWRTQVVVNNPTPASQSVKLELIPRGGSTVSATKEITLTPGETREIVDLYDFFAVADGAGMLRVTGQVATWVRSYNKVDPATFGQDLPGIDPAGGFAAEVERAFPFAGVSDINKDFRSNLILVNLDNTSITFSMQATSGAKTLDVPAGAYAQINNIGPQLGLLSGFGVVRVTANGRWFAVISTIDPLTGDPTTVRGLALDDMAERVFIGVAKIGGSNQTSWNSELILANPGAAAASVHLDLIPRGRSDVIKTKSISIAPGETQRIVDVYTSLGVASGAGSIRINGPVLAWARTFNLVGKQTFGQDLPTISGGSDAFLAGQPVLAPFSTAANIFRDPRSNLLLQNLESYSIVVTLRSGNFIKTQVVPAQSYVQINDLGLFLGTPLGTSVVWISADGRWSGTIATADPYSGDPTTVRLSAEWQPPSSYDLINQALASHAITSEQALIYRVFADFSDPKLPAQLRGDDRFLGETDSLAAATTIFATLSATAKDSIGPYLVPPYLAGSWWDLRRQKNTGGMSAQRFICRPWEEACPVLGDWVAAGSLHLRVFYQKDRESTDKPLAMDLATEGENVIWPALKSLMNREPLGLSDIGASRVDVVLVDGLSSDARTRPAMWMECQNTPAYILFGRSHADVAKRNSLFAHELMHAWQLSYKMQNCYNQYKWLAEATATWFEDFLYHNVQREHSFGQHYQNNPEVSIEDMSNVKRVYGGYLFFLSMTRLNGVPATVVRNVWEATATNDQLHALDAGLKAAGTDLEHQWPDFAYRRWNAEPALDFLKQADSFTWGAQVQMNTTVSIPGGQAMYEVDTLADVTLPHLSSRYFDFTFPDSVPATLAFFNGLEFDLNKEIYQDYGEAFKADLENPDHKGLSVQALLKIGGVWKHEVWTGKRFVLLCRDLKTERVEKLVVIYSNSSITDHVIAPNGKLAPLLWASNIGCGPWEGQSNVTFTWNSGVKEHMTVSGLRLEPMGEIAAAPAPLALAYKTVAGTYAYTVSGSDGSCSHSASIDGSAISGSNLLHLHSYVSGGGGLRGFTSLLLFPWVYKIVDVKVDCGKTSRIDQQGIDGAFFLLSPIPSKFLTVSNNGREININVAPIYKGATGYWQFIAVRE